MSMFSPMDGFFLAIFLAVCILVAVILRCLCYRFCMQSCSDKFRHPNEDGILPRHSTPTITPAGRNQRPQHQSSQAANPPPRPVMPPSGTVFTIYTFPQQPSPELSRPQRTSRPPKYSTVPADAPPKYEDLFPIMSKGTNNMSTAIEMQETSPPSTPEIELQMREFEPPVRNFEPPMRPQTSTSTSRSVPSFAPAVPTNINRTQSDSPIRKPKEDPPLYDTIYPKKSGE